MSDIKKVKEVADAIANVQDHGGDCKATQK